MLQKKTLLLLASASLAGSFVNAAVVLIVDISDPFAVTFTPGPDLPSANSSGWSSLSGLTLYGFFTASHNGDSASASSNFAPNGITPDGSVDAYANGLMLQDAAGLNLWGFGSGSADIQTSQPAFSGTLTMDLASFESSNSFNTIGVERPIFGGDTSQIGPSFGNYVLVSSAIPEPSTYIAASGLLGLIGFIGFRRWKSRAVNSTEKGG